jgi:hypothetical protein
LAIFEEIKKGLELTFDDGGRLTKSNYSTEIIEKQDNEPLKKIATEFAEGSAKLIASLGGN